MTPDSENKVRLRINDPYVSVGCITILTVIQERNIRIISSETKTMIPENDSHFA
jgi:hypothetical protein